MRICFFLYTRAEVCYERDNGLPLH